MRPNGIAALKQGFDWRYWCRRLRRQSPCVCLHGWIGIGIGIGIGI
jgi:hypothetical protein